MDRWTSKKSEDLLHLEYHVSWLLLPWGFMQSHDTVGSNLLSQDTHHLFQQVQLCQCRLAPSPRLDIFAVRFQHFVSERGTHVFVCRVHDLHVSFNTFG